MNANKHIDVEDLLLFALLLLSEEEAAPVRAHLESCAQCTGELARVREDLATYALALEPVPLPEGVRGRFLARIGAPASPTTVPILTPAAAPAASPMIAPAAPSRVPSRALGWLGWAGWAAAAAAAVVALGFRQDRDALQAALSTAQTQSARAEAEALEARRLLGTLTDPDAVRVDLLTPKAPKTPAARATYQPRTGTLLLIASDLRPLAPGKVYELWLIPASGAPPVAAGTFSPDGHGSASLLVPSLRGAVAAKAFGITEEPAGGSPAPTMPILLAGSPA